MIHAIHGVVDTVEPDSQSKRNYVSKRKLESYFKGRSQAYQSFDASNCLSFDVLTVDDATYAAAEACLMARKYGHEVTLFVNPWQIINQQPYYMHLLNCAIDSRTCNSVIYENCEFDLNNHHETRRYRDRVKKHMIRMNELDAIGFSHAICADLMSQTVSLPHYNRTLSIDDLKVLTKEGVNVQSHGWSHRSIDSFNEEGLRNDIVISSEWIYETLGHSVTLYAVPFGRPYLPEVLLKSLKEFCMMCDPSATVNVSHKTHINRLEITASLNCGIL